MTALRSCSRRPTRSAASSSASARDERRGRTALSGELGDDETAHHLATRTRGRRRRRCARGHRVLALGGDDVRPGRVARRGAAGAARSRTVGRTIYVQHCASCHGANLEGQANWQQRLPNGRMPAPPHDDSGHTWHHPDAVLFGITEYGLVPGKYAPPKYESDMPGFGGVLTDDEIRAVLGYIETRWSPKVLEWRAEMLRQSAAARMPVLDVGLSPLAQWIAVPLAALWLLARRRPGAPGGELRGYRA
ncbi:MAG: c-type cytochrome [Burkholderiales bacterium]